MYHAVNKYGQSKQVILEEKKARTRKAIVSANLGRATNDVRVDQRVAISSVTIGKTKVTILRAVKTAV